MSAEDRARAIGAEDGALERLSAALDALAETETQTLVEEARIEARARVRALLAEALAERMLARAQDELLPEGAPSQPPSGARRASAEPDRSARSRSAAERSAAAEEPPATPREQVRERAVPEPAEELGWYVYGIVGERFDAPPMRGIDERHPLEVVPADGLGALASRVSLAELGEQSLQEHREDLAWLERRARRHEQILESVREQGATVVPMRLFTIYESDGSVREMLAREREFLCAALGRLAGRTEWGVKLFAAAGAGEGDGAETAGPGAEEDAGPGQSYMLRRRDADRRREELGRAFAERRDAAHDRLAAVAVEARVNPLQPPELNGHSGAMLLNGVYLVDNDAAEAFTAEVRGLQDECAAERIDVVLTGPWPPYNFVNGTQEVEI